MSTIILIGITLIIIIGIILIACKGNKCKAQGMKAQIESANYSTNCTLTIEKLNQLVKDVYSNADNVGYWQKRTFEDDEIDYPPYPGINRTSFILDFSSIYDEAKDKYDFTLKNLS